VRTWPLRVVSVGLVVALGLVAACSTDDGSAIPPASSSNTETTVATTLETSSTSAADSTTTVVAVGVDEGLLAEQVDAVVFPDDQGAAMVAVLHDDDSIVHAGRGSDQDGNSPVPGSVFRVGSITKVFTSLLTLTLADEGAIDLDAPAADYVARVAVPTGVTVRDLLQHTSGLPNYTDAPGFFESVSDDPQRTWSPEETIAGVQDAEPLFDPGARFSYSNTNYLVLGVLIEEVTGHSYADELRARIIEPLGLTSTYLAGFEEGPAPFGAYVATSLSGPSEPIDFDYKSIATNAWAAGAVVSSAEDLHVLLSVMFDGNIVSSDSLAAMTESQDYGLGLVQLGPGLHGHGGSIPGYQTFVAHAPETGTTAFFVVTNDGITRPPPVDPILERITQN